jgi:hypothetical protein
MGALLLRALEQHFEERLAVIRKFIQEVLRGRSIPGCRRHDCGNQIGQEDAPCKHKKEGSDRQTDREEEREEEEKKRERERERERDEAG